MGDESQASKLDQITDERIINGWKIESRTPTAVVLSKGTRPNHILHLILSVLTFGLWILVWINVAAWGGTRRATIRVHEDGRIIEEMQRPGPLKTWPPKKQEL